MAILYWQRLPRIAFERRLKEYVTVPSPIRRGIFDADPQTSYPRNFLYHSTSPSVYQTSINHRKVHCSSYPRVQPFSRNTNLRIKLRPYNYLTPIYIIHYSYISSNHPPYTFLLHILTLSKMSEKWPFQTAGITAIIVVY